MWKVSHIKNANAQLAYRNFNKLNPKTSLRHQSFLVAQLYYMHDSLNTYYHG